METWYHGSDNSSLAGYDPDSGRSDEANFMFFSSSVNVARRYGDSVFEAQILLGNIPEITIEQWLKVESLPKGDAFIILGEQGSFDFPVDTLVICSKPEFNRFQQLTGEEIEYLDDGLAFKEPEGTDDRQWEDYAMDIYGSIEAFLNFLEDI